jgi:hypothetical protein
MLGQKQHLKEKKKKKCLYGLEKCQVYHALMKTWQDYYNLSKEQVPDKKRIRHYKRVIHNLQDKLRIAPTPFIVFEVLGLYFYKHNPESFKEHITCDLVEKAMIKTIPILESRMPLDERPNMVQELIRSDSALHKYTTEEVATRTRN